MALSSLGDVAPHPQKGVIKFYIYLVSANCIACVCYFMIADYNYIYTYIYRERERAREIDIDINRYRYIDM